MNLAAALGVLEQVAGDRFDLHLLGCVRCVDEAPDTDRMCIEGRTLLARWMLLRADLEEVSR